MSARTSTVQVKGFRKRQIVVLAERARRLGMTTERYIKHLVEEDLAISRQARTTSFAQIMGEGREVDEQELDRLVEASKTRYHRRTSRAR